MANDTPDDDGFTEANFDLPPHLRGPEDPIAYDAWLRAEVERAMADPRPGIPHEVVMAQMQTIIDRRKSQS